MVRRSSGDRRTTPLQVLMGVTIAASKLARSFQCFSLLRFLLLSVVILQTNGLLTEQLGANGDCVMKCARLRTCRRRTR